MKEYIEREPLIKYCTAMFNLAQRLVQSGYAESDIWKGIHQTQQEERKEFLEILKSAPSADVTPVRHGRWIEEHGETFIPIEYDTNGEPILHNYVGYHCSLCGRYEPVQEPYCNCGALMDGKEDGHEISES